MSKENLNPKPPLSNTTFNDLTIFMPKPLYKRLAVLNYYLHFYSCVEAHFLLNQFTEERFRLDS